MSKSKILRIAGFVGTIGAGAALVGAGVTGTGAYFSDTEEGTIAGTVGSIKIDAKNTTLAFDDLLPGEAKSQTADFTNTGRNAQDVWVVFDPDDLGDGIADTDPGDINSRGTFARVNIKGSGTSVFSSGNLNDDPNSCSPGAGDPGAKCKPLPPMIKLKENLAPGGTGSFEFSFMMAAKTTDNPDAVVPVIKPIDYKLVATQRGIAPGAVDSNPVTFP